MFRPGAGPGRTIWFGAGLGWRKLSLSGRGEEDETCIHVDFLTIRAGRFAQGK